MLTFNDSSGMYMGLFVKFVSKIQINTFTVSSKKNLNEGKNAVGEGWNNLDNLVLSQELAFCCIHSFGQFLKTFIMSE